MTTSMKFFSLWAIAVVLVQQFLPMTLQFATPVVSAQESVSCSGVTVAIDSHGNNNVVFDQQVTIEGTIGSDVTGVTVNGIAATLDGTSYSATIQLQAAGDNDVTVVASKSWCTDASESINLYYATDACIDPVTSLEQLAVDGLTVSANGTINTNNQTAKVSGYVGGWAINVSVNGVDATIENMHNFSATIPLQLGNNVVTIIATSIDPNCDEIFTEFTINYAPSSTCEDPLTVVTIDSHTNAQIVTEGTILITGSVEGGIDRIVVWDGDSLEVDATIVGTTWSALIPLTEGNNTIWAAFYPSDADCDPRLADVAIIYQPGEEVCDDPITLFMITSHENGDIIHTPQVTIKGKVMGGVDHIELTDGNNITVPTTIDGLIWEGTIPLTEGVNNIRAIAYPSDGDCDTPLVDVSLTYVPVGVCEDPISTLTVDSHVDGQNVTANPVTLTGTVEGGVESVTVTNTTTSDVVQATINGNVWTALVPLQSSQGDAVVLNHIDIVANPSDGACPLIRTQIDLTNHTFPACEDPIGTLSIDSHVNGQDLNGATSVTLTGKVTGGVSSVTVTNTTTSESVSAVVVDGIWTATIPVQASAANTITVVANPLDSDCPVVREDITFSVTIETCEDPVTLTITNPWNNQSTRNSAITVEGTVSDNASSVTVKGNTISVVSGAFTTSVSLQGGSNTITVIATHTDPNCEEIRNLVVRRTFWGGSGKKSSIDGFCGDGDIDRLEQCDDGNRRDGDGCDTSCQIEEKEEVEKEIKKKKIEVQIRQRVSAPLPLGLPEPPEELFETGVAFRPEMRQAAGYSY